LDELTEEMDTGEQSQMMELINTGGDDCAAGPGGGVSASMSRRGDAKKGTGTGTCDGDHDDGDEGYADSDFKFGAMPESVKQRMVERYFMTRTDDGSDDKSQKAKKMKKLRDHYLKGKEKPRVMWRNNQIVSQKGERFSLVPKESREQVLQNSVKLSWIKGKRSAGPGYGKMNAPGVNIEEWKKRRK